MQSHIAFLGAGNMASAMINGLLTTGFSPLQLRAADPSEEALEGLRALGIQQTFFILLLLVEPLRSGGKVRDILLTTVDL